MSGGEPVMVTRGTGAVDSEENPTSTAHPVSLYTGSNVKNVKWKVLTVGVQPW